MKQRESHQRDHDSEKIPPVKYFFKLGVITHEYNLKILNIFEAE